MLNFELRKLIGTGFCLLFLLVSVGSLLAQNEVRETLVEAVLSDDEEIQLGTVRGLAGSSDPMIRRTLIAWKDYVLYSFEPDDADPIVLVLDELKNDDEHYRGVNIVTESFITDEDGEVMWFDTLDLDERDCEDALVDLIRNVIDLQVLASSDAGVRLKAVQSLGMRKDPEMIPTLEGALDGEEDETVRNALEEAIAFIEFESDDQAARIAAVIKLGEIPSIKAKDMLEAELEAQLAAGDDASGEMLDALQLSVKEINGYITRGQTFGTLFRGVSTSAVLLVAALGLAITFGLMGVINMAHGEMITVGAYSAYVTHELFMRWFGTASAGFGYYFVVSIVVGFFAAAIVGLILERAVIQFLYSRPLESLLATYGVSLVLQQAFRFFFGPNNVNVSSPMWLRGSFVHYDVLFAYNRLFVIGFAVLVVLFTYAVLNKTSIGLQVRSVMQNRAMASCMGVRTKRINMITFAFGSGLAGMAGACFSQIGNVGPNLGQTHIIDCFMVVVLGGVGNIVGTISSALGIGVVDQMLQPALGAVMGKITVLIGIILFLQWKPSGMFPPKGRGLD